MVREQHYERTKAQIYWALQMLLPSLALVEARIDLAVAAVEASVLVGDLPCAARFERLARRLKLLFECDDCAQQDGAKQAWSR